MSYIICIVGKSRSGKDTLASYLEGKLLKFAAPAKRVLEQWYGLDEGDLECHMQRNSLIPGSMTTTYLDVLVKMYHFWLDVDPLAPKYPTIREIEATLNTDTPVILTDARMPQEIDYIVSLPHVYPIYAIRLDRPGYPDVSSDESLDDNWQTLKIHTDFTWEFSNTGTIADLVDFAAEVTSDIHNHQSFINNWVAPLGIYQPCRV